MLKLDMKVTSLTELLGGRVGANFTDQAGVNDAVRGTDKADTINSGGGNDRIYSGGGDDFIDAGAGNDYVEAGTGDDIVKAGAGNDTVHGGDGKDVIFGEAGNDWLYGDAGADLVDGGDGNDWLFGGVGDDTVLGGAGNDQLWGGGGDDVLAGELGNDALRGEAGDDVLDGGNGNDWLSGGSGDDYLLGGSGADWLRGDEGNDILYGSDGTVADNTRDVFEFLFSESRTVAAAVNGVGNDLIGDFETGKDVIDIRSIVARVYDNQQGLYDLIDAKAGGTFTSNGVTFTLGNVLSEGVQSAKLTVATTGGAASVTFHGVEVNALTSANLVKPSWKLEHFGDGADQVSSSVQLVAYAGGGNDTVTGSGFNDRLYGEAGDDTLHGGAGTDWLYGGAGADTVNGGTGNDQLEGNVGVDRLVGGADDDRLWGGADDDVLYGDYDANDSSVVRPTNAVDGADAMWGGAGADKLYGGGGNDSLYGEAGKDTLVGDAGNDLIDGGAGDDSLTGGAGKDTFMFRGNFVIDWTAGSAYLDLGGGATGSNNGHDVIEDFMIGDDKIRLAITGSPDDKSAFTKMLGHTWLPDAPEQDQKLQFLGDILQLIDTDGNGIKDDLRISEHGSPQGTTGDTSWSITLKDVFSDTAQQTGIVLADFFEVT